MRKAIAICAAAAAFAGSAEAATITFASAAATAVPGGFSFSSGGITVTLTAGLFVDDAVGNVTPGQLNAQPKIYSPGVGVSHNGDDDHTIDGAGNNEAVILTFSQNVIIDQITFGYFDGDDDYDFFFDSNSDGVLNRVLNNIDIPNSGVSNLAALFLQPGRWFAIGADGSDDSFKLKAISFRAAPVVPIPAALPLFAAGLAGLGFAARRRRRPDAQAALSQV